MTIHEAPAPTASFSTTEGGVDPETGKISFAKTLVDIPVGSAGLRLDVTLHYDNLITEDVITWNAEAPTGPAGLGWAIGQTSIFRDTRGTGTTLDDRLYLLDGDMLELTPTAQNGSTWTYQAKTADATLNWQVLYYSGEERWTVFKPETGHTLTFGGGVTTVDGQKDSAGHAIEWAVRYGGWMGSTVAVEGEQFAVAWNVRTIDDGRGASLTYTYQQTQAITGRSKKFTQASYVQSITASTGPKVEFVYGQKEAAEIPPSRSRGAGDAYQFRYQTLYLQQLVVTEGGTPSTVDFTYDLLDPMSKRLLTGIAIGAGEREMAFTYYGTDAADGVTVTLSDPNGLYNGATEALYGSLKSMRTSENGVAQEDWLYKYAKVTVDGSERMTTVQINGTNPRLFYGPGYLVLIFENAQYRKVMVQLYEWDNRWALRFENLLDPEDDVSDVLVAVAEDFFVAAAPREARLLAVHRKGDGWSYTRLSLREPTSKSQLAAGDELFGHLDLRSGVLQRWKWTGSGWTGDQITLAGGSDDDYAVGMTANRGFLLTAEIKEDRNQTAKCRLFYLDPLRQWREASSHIIGQPLSEIEEVTITPGEGFVLLDFNTDPLVSDNHTYAMINWNADYSGMRSRLLSSGSNTQIAVAGSAVNHAVQNSKKMYRYNGASWELQTLDNLLFDSDDRAEYLYPDFTLAADNSAGVLTEFQYYSYDPYENRWAAQRNIEVPNEFNTALLKVISLAAKLAVKLALIGVPRAVRYLIKWLILKPLKTKLKATIRLLTSSGVYQYQDTGSAYLAVGTTSGTDQLKVYQQSRSATGPEDHWLPVASVSDIGNLVYDIMSQVDSFFVWMTEDGNAVRHNWATLVRNGKLVTLADGSNRLTLDKAGEPTFSTVPDEDQPLLYTPDTVVSYLSNDGKFRNARTLRFHRVIQDGAQGPLSDFVVSSATDGAAG